MDRQITRRDFVAVGAGAAVAGGLGLSGRADGAGAGTSRVVLVRQRDVMTENGQVRAEVVHDMLGRAVARLLDTEDAATAWRRLISADDVVGVKSNEWSALPTPAALEAAIRSEVVGAGVAEADVAVHDRSVRRDPVFQRATALVNVRPMRTHHWSGLGTCLKNLIMFVPRPADYHANACANLGAIWKLPQVAGKVRLNILVMLTPQFHSVGPHGYSPKFVWPYSGLIVGTDPVAVDATGARIIVARRRLYFGEERPLRPTPHHIQMADTEHGLGNSDPSRIELIRLGWQEDVLI